MGHTPASIHGWPRKARALSLALVSIPLLGGGCSPSQGSETQRSVEIHSTPVALHTDESPDTVGSLRFLAGLELSAPDEPHFGGFSGLAISASGEELVALSDKGRWLRADLRLDPSGKLLNLGAATMGPLLNTDGRPVFETEDHHDSEELVPLPEGFLVSFELAHRLHRYAGSMEPGGAPPDGLPELFPHPPEIDETHPNKGMEAVTYLGANRYLVLTEGLRPTSHETRGWIGNPEDGWSALTLAAHGELQPTATALLDNGDVLLLERSYSRKKGNVLRLSRILCVDLQPGARLDGEELARLERPMTVDNFEALAVHRGPGGELLIYILSDDNFNASQRTLLMQFELLPSTTPQEDNPCDDESRTCCPPSLRSS